MTTFIFLSGENIDWFALAGADNAAEIDVVEVAILVLVALVHHQVVSQKLSGNSQPAASAEPRQLEDRSL